jgi:hypothetical protein
VTDLDEDLFDSASTDFIGPKDIDGRLILFLPVESGKAKGGNGDQYEFIRGDMLVLDGETTKKIPGPFPFEVLGQRLQAEMMVTQLKPRIESQRMLLGRVNSRPGKFGNPAYSFGEPTDADKAVARPHAKAWKARREAAATAADPFAS